MEPIVLFAILGAALLHATWHAMIKVSGDRLLGLAGMNVVSVGISLAVLPLVAVPRIDVWPVLAFSVILHNAYKGGLAQVYRHGDLGQAYPVARGLSPVFATLIALVVLGENPGMGQVVGITLVSSGLIAMASERRQTISLTLLATAALTGLMVAAYSVVDAYGSRLSGDWLSFTVWLMVLDGSCFVGVVAALRGPVLWRTIFSKWRRTLVSGLLGVAAFSVFLWALSRGPVGIVSALRETSVLFASLIGVIVLKERWSLPRLAGAVLIMLGIIAFATRS
jgi:drug/metabolite transporter (DMT)-like permease